jgi:hypothetical protein
MDSPSGFDLQRQSTGGRPRKQFLNWQLQIYEPTVMFGRSLDEESKRVNAERARGNTQSECRARGPEQSRTAEREAIATPGTPEFAANRES